MAGDWHFIRGKESEGPVTFLKLQSMAREGWLQPDDLVWRRGMPEWTHAKKVQGLLAPSLLQMAREAVFGRRLIPEPATDADKNARPPALPEKPSKRSTRRAKSTRPMIALNDLSPRHLLTALGGFLAALGIAFTVIAQTRLALALTLVGLFILAVGLAPEIGRLAAEAIDNIAAAVQEAARRRLRAQEIALEKQRLELEAAKLAHQDTALERLLPAEPVLQPQPAPVPVTSYPAASGSTVVISQPSVKLWSPGLAAVLSLFLPGLGQLYKGQIINGIVWFVVVMLGYASLILPGLLLHFFCVLGALIGNPWSEGKTTVLRE